MPILIRIILQRLLIFVFSILAFFGINPDLSVPSSEFVQESKNIQKEYVEDILQSPDEKSENTKNKTVEDIEKKIIEIQNEFTENITTNIVRNAENIVPTSIIEDENNKIFDIQNIIANIVCLEKTETYTKMSSGSGVIVSSSGLILTNAHVTYPFLRTNQFGSSDYSCSVRFENIPNYGYEAELVYYPIDWLIENKETMKELSPVGTGEHDYALLQITKPLGPSPKTKTFQYALTDINTKDLKINLPITIAGYPSLNSGIFEIDTKPGLKIVQSKIAEFFTFNTHSFDVLRTGINEVAKKGSSGGAILNNSNLYGIIVTTNTNEQGSYINALTIPYIKEDFKKDTGFEFKDFINSSYDILKSRFDANYRKTIENVIF